MTQAEYLRYLGVLGLLGECSVFVDEETRECIERAFEGACAAHPTLTWRRILDRVEILSKPRVLSDEDSAHRRPSADADDAAEAIAKAEGR